MLSLRLLAHDPSDDATSYRHAPRDRATLRPEESSAPQHRPSRSLGELALDTPGEFEALVRQLAPSLIRFAQRIGASAALADEIVMDVFFSLWERRGVLEPATRLEPYLYGAVRNSTLMQLRTERRMTRRHDSMANPTDAGIDSVSDAATAVEENDDRTRLWRAVDALPERQRSAVILRYGKDLPLSEVAEAMGLGVPAVKMLLQRGIQGLRDRLGEPLFGD